MASMGASEYTYVATRIAEDGTWSDAGTLGVFSTRDAAVRRVLKCIMAKMYYQQYDPAYRFGYYCKYGEHDTDEWHDYWLYNNVCQYSVETWIQDDGYVSQLHAYFDEDMKRKIMADDLSSAETVSMLRGYKRTLAAGEIPADLQAVMETPRRGWRCKRFPTDREAWVARHGSGVPYPWGAPEEWSN